jgi:serine/threonine protein phosphatase PrpC
MSTVEKGGLPIARTIAVAIASLGKTRKHQEDRYYLLDAVRPAGKLPDDELAATSDEGMQFFAVADGMGGQGVGDRAAQLALDCLDKLRRQQRLDRALDFTAFSQALVEQANSLIRQALAKYAGLPCGTTLSVLAIDQGVAWTLSLGNSRIYRFRDGALQCLTHDHLDTASNHRRLSQYLGYLPDQSIPVPDNVNRFELARGDILLLTTDGLTDVLPDEQIRACLQAPAAFLQQIHLLRDQALEHAGRDNLTILAVKIQQVTTTPTAPAAPAASAAAAAPTAATTPASPAAPATPATPVASTKPTTPAAPTVPAAPQRSQPHRVIRTVGQPPGRGARLWDVFKPLLFLLGGILIGLGLGFWLFGLPG